MSIGNAIKAESGNIKAGDNSLQAFDVDLIRKDFPILQREIYGRPLVYLDSAASAQKPRQVLDRMNEAYETYYSNVHRGVHSLSQTCTEAFESGRTAAARYINAETPDQCILTKGATEAINLVAQSYGRHFLKAGDEIIISHMEHHSNIVPWQILRDQIGIVIKVVPIDGDANFLFDEYEKLFSAKTKLVAITHISNAVGTVTPIKDIIRVAHHYGAKVLVDGCQAAPHAHIDVQDLDADFYCFSGHKVYGPSGIGILYGKADLLNSMPPYQGGGEMIDLVTFEKTTYKEIPHRFEAGTPAIVEAIGLGAAIEYIEAIGRENIAAHENGILAYATERLSRISGLTIIGRAKEKASILSFTMQEAHAHDIGTILDRRGVAVRAGHHCAQPLMQRFNLPATARASFGIYNTRAEVDALADALEKVQELFS
ncbi:cysteine desulfurase [Kiloniella antarctica]|uniref:cysteine desulfurase n=1 Tax=Kiloniella antarctica TaxID=1550907 RepID=A0ABW5BMX2_9PROT